MTGDERRSQAGTLCAAATSPWDAGEELCLPELFDRVARDWREHTAVCSPTERWTYGELDERSGAIAAALADRGVKTSEPVAILLSHAPPLVAAIMGVLRAGAMYVCLDPSDPSARHQAALADAQPRWLITDAEHAQQAVVLKGERTAVITIDELDRRGGVKVDADHVSGDSGAWLMYTSGSTGRPKGVWQSHRNVIHHTRIYTDLARIASEDHLSMLASGGVAASASALFGALLNGATLAMFPIRRESVDSLARWLDEEVITICHLAPSVFRRLARTTGDPGRWSRMRMLRLGGESVLLPDIELYRRVCPDTCVLMHALSSTETGLICQLMIDKSTRLPDTVTPVGHPVPDVEVLILDESGQPCEPGDKGRIAVQSRHLAMGYWRQPELSALAFQTVPSRPDIRQFVSGDLGRVRSDGCLEHHGRIDRQVKIRGWRVDVGAVEAAIRATGRIAEAAVVTKRDARGEVCLAAYVVPGRGVDRGEVVWRQLLRDVLPSQMIPEKFVEMTSLPQTPGGKIDHVALATLPTSLVERRPRGRTPRDRIEKKVAAIWEAVLDMQCIALDDDFFDLGGDSLRSVDVLLKVEQAFDVSLSPSSLVEHPSLGSFAAVVAKGTVPRTRSPLVAMRPSGGRPPLFLLPPASGNPACFGPLARLLHPEQPVYAFRLPGMHGECWPLMSVRAMAKRYVQEVVAVAPTGPYLLGGRCAGGLIAMEMARQLARTGKTVPIVLLIDTPHPSLRPGRARWRHRITDGIRDLVRLVRWGILRVIGISGHPIWLPGYRHFVGAMATRAMQAYRPRPCDSDLTLFIASELEPALRKRLMRMSCLSGESKVITVPGGHEEMLRQPAVHSLAMNLQACLDAIGHDNTRAAITPSIEEE